MQSEFDKIKLRQKNNLNVCSRYGDYNKIRRMSFGDPFWFRCPIATPEELGHKLIPCENKFNDPGEECIHCGHMSIQKSFNYFLNEPCVHLEGTMKRTRGMYKGVAALLIYFNDKLIGYCDRGSWVKLVKDPPAKLEYVEKCYCSELPEGKTCGWCSQRMIRRKR